jgi:hypothetical protein
MQRVKLTLSKVNNYTITLEVTEQDYNLLKNMEAKPISEGSEEIEQFRRIVYDINSDIVMTEEPSTLIVEKL